MYKAGKYRDLSCGEAHHYRRADYTRTALELAYVGQKGILQCI